MAAKTDNQREALIQQLLTGTHTQPTSGRTLGEWAEDTMTDAAASTFSAAAKIGGALTAAVDNAKQSYSLERNFRQAERQVKARRTAERYADRLSAILG